MLSSSARHVVGLFNQGWLRGVCIVQSLSPDEGVPHACISLSWPGSELVDGCEMVLSVPHCQ